jgi:hypothetical protein
LPKYRSPGAELWNRSRTPCQYLLKGGGVGVFAGAAAFMFFAAGAAATMMALSMMSATMKPFTEETFSQTVFHKTSLPLTQVDDVAVRSVLP